MSDVLRNVSIELSHRSGVQSSKAIRLWGHPTIRYVIYRGYRFYTEDCNGAETRHASREDCVEYILDRWEK